MTTNYHSILPSSNNEEELAPLTGHYYNNTHNKRPWKFVWMIPAFCLGVTSVAALFVLQSSSFHSNTTSNDEQQQQEEPMILPEIDFRAIEQWDEWKDDMVQAAQHYRLDVKQAWAKSSPRDEENEDTAAALLLQDWWGRASQQAQEWWQDIATSTKHLLTKTESATQDDGQEARAWLKEVGNTTQKEMEDAAKATKEWTDQASHKTKKWVKKEGSNAKHLAKRGENATADFVQEVANETEHVAATTGKEAGHWIGEEATKTKEWTKHAENKTGHWIGKESNEAGHWIKKEAGRAGHAAGEAAHWTGEEARGAGGLIVKEGNATEHFVVDETKRGAEWVGDETKRGAHGTEEWFKEESNVTEHWISKEARDSANWFRKETNETGHWFKKESNATGKWFKKQSNRTVHWWEADAEAVRIWWHNVTHRNKVQDESLVYFNTTAAFALLVSGYGWYDSSRDFFTYQQGFDVQENQAYCSVASAAAVINSFRGRLDLPIDPLYKPYPYATEDSLFNECTDENVTVHNATFDGLLAAPGGLNLDQTKSLFECNLPRDGWAVEAHHVDPSEVSLDDMRKDLVMALMSPASRVVVNFHRAAATQKGSGHFSPLGGYSHERDAFLLMDVAKYKYPFVWIPASVLYRSLMTVDACGSWKSPNAQVSLEPKLKHPKSARDLSKALPKLGCKAAYRGYLIVKQL